MGVLHAGRLEADSALPVAEQATAHAIARRMVVIYVLASVWAVVFILPLIVFGLEFKTWQWLSLFRLVPLGFALYVTIDIIVIFAHLRPVRRVLAQLDAGETPDPADTARAMTRALNLPFFAFLRVSCVHGPLATLVVSGGMAISNSAFGLGFAVWQNVAFSGAALLFASPTHAIFEYFAVGRAVEPAIARLGRALGGPLPAEYRGQLVAIRLKEKLLYLAIAVASLPLVFFAISVSFKVDRLMKAY